MWCRMRLRALFVLEKKQPRSQGLSSYRLGRALGGKMRDPGNEVEEKSVRCGSLCNERTSLATSNILGRLNVISATDLVNTDAQSKKPSQSMQPIDQPTAVSDHFTLPVHSMDNIELSLNQKRRALVLLLCLIPCHRYEKSARESRNFHHFITQVTQRDNILARAQGTCVDQRGYMTSGWRNLF